MTDDHVENLVKALRPNDAYKQWILPIAIAVSVYWITSNQDKTNDATTSLSALSQQIAALSISFEDIKSEVRVMQAQLNTARVDPFTGQMADVMRESIEAKIEREREDCIGRNEKMAERVRSIESSVSLMQNNLK